MASAAAEFESRMVQEKWDRPFDISRSSSLLIDDDANNVAIALSNGVRAIPYDPTNRSYK